MNTVTPPVVVGVDGSAPSQLALQWAAQAASTRGLPLMILYGTRFAAGPYTAYYASADAEGTGHDILHEAEMWVKDRYPDLVCHGRFAHEDPAPALVDASAGAALVVVGSRGHGGFHDLLLGSTSLHTAMHAYCPVAVVRPTVAKEGGAEGRIVVGVDGSPHSRVALQLAFAEAQLSDRPVTAVHAYASALTAHPSTLMPHVPDPEGDRQRAEHLLNGELRFWQAQHPGVRVEAAPLQGSPSGVLVRQSQGAHLVVVGSRGHGGFTGLLFGSVGHALIHHAGCPVLIAHQAGPA